MTEMIHPGGGSPLHLHSCEDESFLVIKGCISCFVADVWTGMSPGFEKLFTTSATEFAQPSGPSKKRLIQIYLEHGIELLEHI